MGLTSDFEQFLNWLQVDTFSLLVDFSHELAHIMTTYDFLSPKQAILSNVWTDFQLYPISLLVTFSHALAYIMTTYDFLLAKQVILSNVWTDFNLTPISLLVNFWHELAHIMITYDFLGDKQVILTMFEPTPTWPDFTIGQLLIWIG